MPSGGRAGGGAGGLVGTGGKATAGFGGRSAGGIGGSVAAGGKGGVQGSAGDGPGAGAPAKGGTGSGASGGVGPAGPPVTRQFFLIDDLEDENQWVGPVLGARGAWYVASEGLGSTFPTSGCAPVTSPATEFVDHASNAAMHFYGSGGFTYAQIGIGLRSGAPACDQPLYALGMTGIRFWAKGTSSLQHVRFMIGTPEVTPPEYGGTCQVGCYNYPKVSELFNDEWREYLVPFAALGVFTPTILTLIWESEQSDCFDFWLDDVAFYKDE
jgi:hypothetical protein